MVEIDRNQPGMYTNIVIGVDGRDGGRDAVALAALLGRDAAEIAVVHVSAAEARHIVERDRKLLGRAADALCVEASSVGAGLDRVAAKRGADLIVIGSCHRGAIGRVLAGDDAGSVLHHAHRSVALAPRSFRNEPALVQTVGVAYDGLPESLVALQYAESLAEGFGAELRARCIALPDLVAMPIGPGASYEEAPEDVIARTRQQLGSLERAKLDVVVGVVGSIGTELTAFSEEVDVLLCGSRHNGALRRVTLGSTSDYLAHHAHCALIVTPAPSERSETAVGDRSSAAPL